MGCQQTRLLLVEDTPPAEVVKGVPDGLHSGSKKQVVLQWSCLDPVEPTDAAVMP